MLKIYITDKCLKITKITAVSPRGQWVKLQDVCANIFQIIHEKHPYWDPLALLYHIFSGVWKTYIKI